MRSALLTVSSFFLLLAGCQFTINGNPDVSLLTIMTSPLRMTVPLLDSGDRMAPLTFIATVQGDQANSSLIWVSKGSGGDSIVGFNYSAQYFPPHQGSSFSSIFDTIQASASTDPARSALIFVRVGFPNDVPFLVVPMEATLRSDQTLQFVIDTIHGNTISRPIAWSVQSGPGTITNSGLYMPPTTLTTDSAVVVILAQSGSDTSTATITLLKATDMLRCFSRDIQPIMQSCNGSSCHDGSSRPVLDYKETLRSVKPGDARGSRLYQLVTELNANNRMPPPPAPALTPQQVLTIGQWIDEGAQQCQ